MLQELNVATSNHNRAYDSLTDFFPAEDYLNSDGKFDPERFVSQFPLVRQDEQGKSAKRVPNSDDKTHSSIYRSIHTKDKIISRVYHEYNSVLDYFNRAVEVFGDRDCLGTRLTKPDGSVDDFFTYDSYTTVGERRNKLGSGLRTLVGQRDKFVVSIYSANRPEWVITLLACQSHDMIYTALYDTLGPQTSSYILNLTESPVIVCSREKIVKLIELKKTAGLPHLKYIVSMDPLNLDKDFGIVQMAQSQDIRLLDFSQVETIGQLNPLPQCKPKAEDVYGISFTSGTTGNPKGVEITHKMSMGHLTFSVANVEMKFEPNKTRRVLSFLPLAHIYEVTNMAMQLCFGCSIAYAPDPSPLKLVENLAIVKPHFVALVPRVYTKFEAALKDVLSQSFIGRQILHGIEAKMKSSTDDGPNTSFILDNLALKGVAKKLGFIECDLAVSGSAPINAETVSFLRNALSCGFAQGYGLTESTSGISISGPWDQDITCGAVAPSCEIRLRDIPEMNYRSHDANGVELEEPHGELLLRGPQIFEKYYKNEKATKESFDSEGWFLTGDVAKVDKRGRILIVDRVKNFFKLAQGEYITPERIENTYLSSCSFLTQMYVHGDSLKTYLISVVGVDIAALKNHLGHHKRLRHLTKLDETTLLDKINSSPEIKRAIIVEMNKAVQSEGLHGFEKINNAIFMVEPLKVSDDTITPTLKLKRNIAFKFFKNELEKLYEEGSLIQKDKL
ncbi:CYFA0S01e19042g1_1 [Cyberlindnera fabianii]|uniref:CYFA0S01e19042g1_1 n=1 Tax=Cyberlindnera fabianii TaxID=36022 RepID=A0A061AK26_CYBFA|nr:CYFA0S01e19042g1_1 [Cyberlindnera fabianii]